MRLRFIFVILFFIFTFFVQTAFAADAQVSGKILDNNNNPVSQGVVVFVDASGKTIGAATSDMEGLYKIAVPTGIYTIFVEGPKGSGLQKITLPNNKISSAAILDFTLTAPVSPAAKKPTILQSLMPVIIGIVVVFFVGIAINIFWRKKHVTRLS